MNAMVPSIFAGFELGARSLSSSCRDRARGRSSDCAGLSRRARTLRPWRRKRRAISPIASLITLRWNHGGRKVSSATIQRGGKMTKSALARPGTSLGLVRTVKIDGSGWSKLIEPIDVEPLQLIAPGHVIAVPGDDIERRMVERRRPQAAERFLDDLGRLVLVLEPSHRRFEIARVGEAVGADRAKFGQAKRQAVIFGDIAARFAIDLDAEFDAARHQRRPSPAQFDGPSSVTTRSAPDCGMSSISPSASTNTRRSIDSSTRDRGAPRTPSRSAGSRLASIVTSPSMKSLPSGRSGAGPSADGWAAAAL